jgi:transcriptional regulator GlxA family with amidase domain
MARKAGPVLDVTVVLLDAGYASTAIGPIEVFHSAGLLWNRLHGDAEEPRFRVRTASIDGKSIGSLCGLRISPELAIRHIRRTDIIVLPASGLEVQERIARNTALLPWLRKWYSRGAYIAGICSGVAFLAESGILDGRQATSHWALAEKLRERYPKVRWRPEQFVTEDRRVCCSGGVYASIDLSLYWWRNSAATRSRCSAPARSWSACRAAGNPDTRCCRCRARTRRAHPPGGGASAAELHARRVDRQPRRAHRHEPAQLHPPLQARHRPATRRLPQMLRMSSAREMLEHGELSIQKVCARVGYEDAAFFRNLFKRHTGMTPVQYRERFAQMTFERGDLSSGRAPA